MARVMENHSKSLLPIPDVTSTTTRGFATQVFAAPAQRNNFSARFHADCRGSKAVCRHPRRNPASTGARTVAP